MDMLLLVSTPLHILLVDPVSGRSSTVRTGDGYYYGITYKEGTMVLSHSGGNLGYFGQHAHRTINHLIQPHQVEWIEDKVVVSNTGKNCLSVFDERGEFTRDVYLNDIHWDDKEKGRSGNHFNSVHRHGERVYVVAHNYERWSEVWELSWPALEVTHTFETRANWAHNFWAGEHGLVTCNSKHGTLLEISTGETIWSSNEANVMTRGLAVSSEHIFIGASMHNKRKDRYWKDGGIWIVDRRSLKTIEKIHLPGSGDVHEIRLIGIPDDCHNNQVIPNTAVDSIRKTSPIIHWCYELRKSVPLFRRDFFPMSQIVRAKQLYERRSIP